MKTFWEAVLGKQYRDDVYISVFISDHPVRKCTENLVLLNVHSVSNPLTLQV